MNQTLTLRRVYEALRLTPEILSDEELERGLSQLQARLLRLGVEAHEAETLGRSLADAVSDELTFPAMHRLHLGVRDILTMSLPPELVRWARQALALPESPSLHGLSRTLAALAASRAAAPATRALARLMLFEAVRIGMMVAEHLSGSSIAAVGAGAEDVDAIAEGEVAAWVARAGEVGGPVGLRTTGGEAERSPLLDEEVRPLEVLVAGALLQLERHTGDLREVLYRLDDDLATALRVRAAFELRLREMEAGDALLLRNAFAPALDEQRLEVERLRDEHALVLGDTRRAALDQRVSRLRRRMASGEWPTRRGEALIDLIAESED